MQKVVHFVSIYRRNSISVSIIRARYFVALNADSAGVVHEQHSQILIMSSDIVHYITRVCLTGLGDIAGTLDGR